MAKFIIISAGLFVFLALARANEESENIPLPTFDGTDIIESVVKQADNVVINYVGDQPFREKYPERCGRSTKLEIRPDQEPDFVLIRDGGRPADKRISMWATDEEILASGFDPKKRTTIFVHGWTQSWPRTPYLMKTIELIEKQGVAEKHNYMVYSWGNNRLSKNSYADVAAWTSQIGNYLAVFIQRLINLGQDRLKIHLISHSLGTHVAGAAGKRVRPPIGRITGLDSAGPCFGRLSSNGPDDRLMRDDAVQVDLYHYDNILGFNEPSGDVDVYVNGGKDQPGCPSTYGFIFYVVESKLTKKEWPSSPSHTRSSFVSAYPLVEGKCQQVAYECSDYETFKKGKCGECGENNEKCFVMAFPYQYKSNPEFPQSLRDFKDRSQQFHIIIPKNSIYCTNHYQVQVKFDPTPEFLSASNFNLNVKLTYELDGEQGQLEFKMTNKMEDHVFTHLLTVDEGPFIVTGAQVSAHSRWYQIELEGEEISPTAHKVDELSVKYMSNIEPETRLKHSTRLCPNPTSTKDKALEFGKCKQ